MSQTAFGHFVTEAVVKATHQALAEVKLGVPGEQAVMSRKLLLEEELSRTVGAILRRLGAGDPIRGEDNLVKPVSSAIVSTWRTQTFPEQFFVEGPGLFIPRSFRDRLESLRSLSPTLLPERSYVALRLKQNAFDSELQRHVAEPSVADLADIAALIWSEQAGRLNKFFRADGASNIFFVAGADRKPFAIDVCHIAGRWHVLDSDFDEEGGWDAGDQFICPGTLPI
jgi:hypothetical protein